MPVTFRAGLVVLLATALTGGCGAEKGGEAGQSESRAKASHVKPGGLKLTSPAFAEGETIPVRYTCDGENVSPRLDWSEPPPGTTSFALVCNDPDAPVGDWVHWVVWDIPPDFRSLEEAFPDLPELENGIKQGRTDFKRPGYGGPCPPPGIPHRYFFNLYALSEPLNLQPGAERGELMAAIVGKVLAQGQLMGRFGR